MKLGWKVLSRWQRAAVVVFGASAALAAAYAATTVVVAPVTVHEWVSRAAPASQGRIIEVEGRRIQQRYPFGGFPGVRGNYERWPTHATGSPEYFPPRRGEMPRDIVGDPARGLALLRTPALGPCFACHVVPERDVLAGNIGPDLRAIGARGLSNDFLYQIVYDPRVIFGPDTPMPAFGASGMWTPEQIVHVVAYMQSLKDDPPGTPERVTDDPNWDPATRPVYRPDYGDPLDPTANPGMLLTDTIAVPMWSRVGPRGQSCMACHGAIGEPDAKRTLGVIPSMVGVGTRWPKWMPEHRRMMSIEDFLAVHAPAKTGIELPTQSQENMTMSILIRMQSNGMPFQIDLNDPNVQAAVRRGEELFNRRVGQRGHSCMQCHTARGGGGHKFLSGRFLADAEKDTMVNHPYFRTAWQQLKDFRMRVQWCVTPLGTNMLPGDAPEYADLETFFLAMQTRRGATVQVPRLAH